MTFDEVLPSLIDGEKIRRDFWENSTFLYMVDGSKFPVSRPPLNNIVDEGTIVNYESHVDIFEVINGEYYASVFNFTQDDILAVDWEILDDTLGNL